MRGFLVVAYSLSVFILSSTIWVSPAAYLSFCTSWWSLGGLCASIALKVRSSSHPFDYKVPIYTQFAMIGLSIIIFVILPESPWWLVSKGKMEKAEMVLQRKYGKVPGYDISEELVRYANSDWVPQP